MIDIFPANNIKFWGCPGDIALKFGLRCKSTSWGCSDGKFFWCPDNICPPHQETTLRGPLNYFTKDNYRITNGFFSKFIHSKNHTSWWCIKASEHSLKCSLWGIMNEMRASLTPKIKYWDNQGCGRSLPSQSKVSGSVTTRPGYHLNMVYSKPARLTGLTSPPSIPIQ